MMMAIVFLEMDDLALVLKKMDSHVQTLELALLTEEMEK